MLTPSEYSELERLRRRAPRARLYQDLCDAVELWTVGAIAGVSGLAPEHVPDVLKDPEGAGRAYGLPGMLAGWVVLARQSLAQQGRGRRDRPRTRRRRGAPRDPRTGTTAGSPPGDRS